MNNKQLYSTSLGRIYMMLRADIMTHKMTLLALYGVIILLFFAMPRIPLLFGEEYQEWCRDYANDFSIMPYYFIALLASNANFYIYVNRRVVHSTPTTYATLPAEWWEKAISLVLYGLVLSILLRFALLTFMSLEQLANPYLDINVLSEIWQTNPRPWESIIWGIGNNVDSEVSSYLHFMISLMVVAGLLGYHLIPFYMVLKIRNVVVGLLLALLQAFGALLILGFIFVYSAEAIFGDGPAISNGVVYNSAIFPWLGAIAALMWGVVLCFFYLMVRKLRTITS